MRASRKRRRTSRWSRSIELKKYAPLILTQTVQNKAMPLGNQTAMTEDERAKIGQWIAAPVIGAPTFLS